jgi:acyl-coenzyme A thioesterase PaaI-like protein
VSTLAETLRRAKERHDVGALVESIPYLRFLGVTADLSTGELLGKMAFAEALIGNVSLPALHGGTIGALLEATASLQVLWETETVVLPKIVTITVDFLRSGRPVDTFARGQITKAGRRVVNVGVEAWQEDRARPIARANAIFLIETLESPTSSPV